MCPHMTAIENATTDTSPKPRQNGSSNNTLGNGAQNTGTSVNMKNGNAVDLMSQGNISKENIGKPAESSEKKSHDGTYFFGGAGMNGDYIADMVTSFEEAGISDVHAINREEWSGTTYADAIVGILALNEEVDVSEKLLTMREKFQGQGDGQGQLNLVGYSYGSLVAAHVAMTRTLKGGTVDNLVLIGSPITSEFLTTLRNNPGIRNVIVRDLATQGDPIRAGMSGFSVVTSAPQLFYQQVTGTGHFYYAGSGEAGQARRRELAKDLYNSGLR